MKWEAMSFHSISSSRVIWTLIDANVIEKWSWSSKCSIYTCIDMISFPVLEEKDSLVIRLAFIRFFFINFVLFLYVASSPYTGSRSAWNIFWQQWLSDKNPTTEKSWFTHYRTHTHPIVYCTFVLHPVDAQRTNTALFQLKQTNIHSYTTM